MAELLEKIPAEKRWLLTAKALLNLLFLRGSKTVVPFLGKGEGVIAPVMGWKKYEEINTKIWAEGGKKFLPWVKETFNIPVKNAIGAYNLAYIVGSLTTGPEGRFELSEASKERTVFRSTKCPWMERYKEYKVAPMFIVCPSNHQTVAKEGLKAINPKLNYKLIKAMPWGDPYCEGVFEFKEE